MGVDHAIAAPAPIPLRTDRRETFTATGLSSVAISSLYAWLTAGDVLTHASSGASFLRRGSDSMAIQELSHRCQIALVLLDEGHVAALLEHHQLGDHHRGLGFEVL